MSRFIEKLLSNDSAGRREVVRAQLRVAVAEALLLRMEALGLGQSSLAKKLGVTRSAVSQALTGSRNMSLNTLADLADALELEARVVLEPRSTASQPILVESDAKTYRVPIVTPPSGHTGWLVSAADTTVHSPTFPHDHRAAIH